MILKLILVENNLTRVEFFELKLLPVSKVSEFVLEMGMFVHKVRSRFQNQGDQDAELA
ncbi:hypothetical protein [Planktothrix agardhii]|uniref:hypothetical protein n=1 Tax=Planktothrix agardhii TaxID=1160 RepID=UPI001F2D3118|nr:hypothetical protein [Planktothrix agardhii]